MKRNGFTQEERNKIIEQYNELSIQFRKTNSSKKRKELKEIKNNLKKEYYDNIPIVTMGVCPICNKSLYRTFDPYFIDGFWWDKSAFNLEGEPESCEHFFLLGGVVNSNNIEFDRSIIKSITWWKSYTPDLPYVSIHELKDDGRFAVLCQLDMNCGFTAYSIAYFSEPPKKTGRFTDIWKYGFDLHIEDDGSQKWSEQMMSRDFNLLPWLESGKLKWCDPGSGNNVLSTKPYNECPFLNLSDPEGRENK